MKTKKTVILVLALLMILAALPSQGASAANSRAIVVGTGEINEGNTIWFGNYNGAPVHWRVMGDGNDGNIFMSSVLLLSDCILANDIQFNPKGTGNVWQDSAAQRWCTGFYNDAFSAGEKTALIETSKNDASYGGKYYNFGTSSLDKEHVFFLSAEEAENIYFPRGAQFEDDGRIANDLNGNPSTWWLRSRTSYYNVQAGFVNSNGYVDIDDIESSQGARPAFNLDRHMVLFTSAAEGGKASGPLGANALIEVPTTDTTEWKLTLPDESRNFSVSDVVISSKNVVFKYDGATPYNADTAPNEYISAMISEGDSGIMTYYGRLAQPASSSGTLTINLSGITLDPDDQLLLFSEQYNGDKKSDYISTGVFDLSTVFSLEKNAYAITNILTNITTDNNEFYRLMSDTNDYTAKLTADGGYCLPEEISVRVGGAELERNVGYTYDSTSGDLVIFANNFEPPPLPLFTFRTVFASCSGGGPLFRSSPAYKMNSGTGSTGGDIEIEANGVPEGASSYSVTVQKEGHGTASATPISGSAGTEIALNATPDSGWILKEWQIVPGDIKISNNKFTMPNSDVVVKAIFVERPLDPTDPEEATVTFDPAGGKWEDGTTAPKTVTTNVGNEITILDAPAREGYEFKHWEGSAYQPGEKYQVPSGGHRFTAVWIKSVSTKPTDKDQTLPKTGENVEPYLWSSVLLFVAGGLLIVFRKKKSKQKG